MFKFQMFKWILKFHLLIPMEGTGDHYPAVKQWDLLIQTELEITK